jgi:hypothetical protein
MQPGNLDSEAMLPPEASILEGGIIFQKFRKAVKKTRNLIFLRRSSGYLKAETLLVNVLFLQEGT